MPIKYNRDTEMIEIDGWVASAMVVVFLIALLLGCLWLVETLLKK
jgi:hypothetical protein